MARAKRRTPIPKPPAALPSPWLTATQAGAYLHRSPRFVLREIRAGRLRAAVVGGRGEILTRTEWCDDWVKEKAGSPLLLPMRRRGTAT
jgi:hypothetical protein